MEERLQKIISAAGIASRRAAEKLILAGKVTVDGKIVTKLGTKVDQTAKKICVEGKPIAVKEKKVYRLLYKPAGYVSTAKDERGRKTVLDLLPDVKERIYPVGRLDMMTEGLLLLTNDGELMQHLLHPAFEVKKTYVATVRGLITKEMLKKLSQGIMLEDGMTAPADVQLLDSAKGIAKVEITIHEGRNRQVRRMFAALGLKVTALIRTHFAEMSLKKLARRQSRMLTADELARLRKLAGLELE